MVERNGFRSGEPCWADVLAPDVDAARRFYGAVFGWTYLDTGPVSGNYVMCRYDGRLVAGISPMPPDDAGDGDPVPAGWSVYLAADDVDAIAGAIDRCGGRTLMGPMEIPGSGRMVFGLDPGGAAFGAWEAGGHAGAELYAEPGALCWAEVNTRDPAATDAFYAGLFGYRQEQIGDGQGFDYTSWTVPGADPVCGRLAMTPDWTGIPPHWRTYFGVEDTDAAVERVLLAGGEVRSGPFDSQLGRIAVVADPHGAAFGISGP